MINLNKFLVTAVYFTKFQFPNLNNGVLGEVAYGDDGYYLLTDEFGFRMELPENFENEKEQYHVHVIAPPLFIEDSFEKHGKLTIYKPNTTI